MKEQGNAKQVEKRGMKLSGQMTPVGESSKVVMVHFVSLRASAGITAPHRSWEISENLELMV